MMIVVGFHTFFKVQTHVEKKRYHETYSLTDNVWDDKMMILGSFGGAF